MAAVPVTLIGTFSFDTGGTVTGQFGGVAYLTGLSVGGGPMPGGPPLGIWGGAPVPVPTPPIHLGPGGEPLPPQIGGGPIYPGSPAHPIVLPPPPNGGPGVPAHPIVIPPGDPAYPAHPIVLPPPPAPGVPAHPIVLPPEPPDVSPSPPDVAIKPPPAEGGWAYVSGWGWGFFPGPSHAGPKR